MIVVEAVKNEAWWLKHYLGLWAGWMRSKEDLPEGCPSEASGGLTPYLSMDFDGMCERMDAEHAETVHVAIHRLPDTQRNALYFECGLIATLELFRYQVVLDNAKQALTRELKRLGLWFGE